jgi:hypothetical protein
MLSYTDLAVAVSEADAYAEARAWSNWTGEDEVKLAALRRGQDCIAQRYNDRWLGNWSNDDAPEPVKYAIIEAARRELADPGSLSPDFVASRQVKTEKKGVGPLTKETTYADTAGAASVRPSIAAIDNLLVGLLAAAGGGSISLLRV